MDDKECPFCYELIKQEAIKCRHCGSMLDQPRQSNPLQSTYQQKVPLIPEPKASFTQHSDIRKPLLLAVILFAGVLFIFCMWTSNSAPTTPSEESKDVGLLQAIRSPTIDNSPKIRQMILDGTLAEGQDKNTVEYVLKKNGLEIDPSRSDKYTDCYGTTVDEINRGSILPIKNSVYDLYISGNEQYWTLLYIWKSEQ